jgi:hypothetical protein
MPLVVRAVCAAGYRSVRAIRFPVGKLSVFLGPSGADKTISIAAASAKMSTIGKIRRTSGERLRNS